MLKIGNDTGATQATPITAYREILAGASERIRDLYVAVGRVGATACDLDHEDLCGLLTIVRGIECDIEEMAADAKGAQ